MIFKLLSRFKHLHLTIIMLSVSCLVMAQRTVSGKVLSTDRQEPLQGVTVAVKGTNSQTATDSKGIYKIEAGIDDILVFSSIGFVPREIKAADAGDVALITSTNDLSEVVVTALGIKREEKSLGYAAQTVKENAVKDAKTNNWVNSLSGKVAGLIYREQEPVQWVHPE